MLNIGGVSRSQSLKEAFAKKEKSNVFLTGGEKEYDSDYNDDYSEVRTKTPPRNKSGGSLVNVKQMKK